MSFTFQPQTACFSLFYCQPLFVPEFKISLYVAYSHNPLFWLLVSFFSLGLCDGYIYFISSTRSFVSLSSVIYFILLLSLHIFILLSTTPHCDFTSSLFPTIRLSFSVLSQRLNPLNPLFQSPPLPHLFPQCAHPISLSKAEVLLVWNNSLPSILSVFVASFEPLLADIDWALYIYHYLLMQLRFKNRKNCLLPGE